MYRIPSFLVLAGGVLLLSAAVANARPVVVRPLPAAPAVATAGTHVLPGSDPRTWSPYPLNPHVMPGSDPRTWSPYPVYPYRYFDHGPFPYWLQNPYWRQTMPASSAVPYVPYVSPYSYG